MPMGLTPHVLSSTLAGLHSEVRIARFWEADCAGVWKRKLPAHVFSQQRAVYRLIFGQHFVIRRHFCFRSQLDTRQVQSFAVKLFGSGGRDAVGDTRGGSRRRGEERTAASLACV